MPSAATTPSLAAGGFPIKAAGAPSASVPVLFLATTPCSTGCGASTRGGTVEFAVHILNVAGALAGSAELRSANYHRVFDE
jgi:hypothetical protein